uniref:Uncharacterized protein n=1 Tax=Catharus ustulatus TaxID=91951 RepID=A0A8C3UWS4_CATUS
MSPGQQRCCCGSSLGWDEPHTRGLGRGKGRGPCGAQRGHSRGPLGAQGGHSRGPLGAQRGHSPQGHPPQGRVWIPAPPQPFSMLG